MLPVCWHRGQQATPQCAHGLPGTPNAVLCAASRPVIFQMLTFRPSAQVTRRVTQHSNAVFLVVQSDQANWVTLSNSYIVQGIQIAPSMHEFLDDISLAIARSNVQKVALKKCAVVQLVGVDV